MNRLSWDYRVILNRLGEYEIREVYYREGSVFLYTAAAIGPVGGDIDDLRRDLERLMGALDRPVLLESELPVEPR